MRTASFRTALRSTTTLAASLSILALTAVALTACDQPGSGAGQASAPTESAPTAAAPAPADATPSPDAAPTRADETLIWGYVVPASTPANIAAAVKAADRSDEMRARDVDRKPAETLTLAHVGAGDKMVEFAAFGQYYTTMLSAAVGPEGHVSMIDLPYTAERNEAGSRAFVEAHPNTDYQLVDYNAATLPADLDAVHIVLYYHDLSLNGVDLAAFNKKVFDALKPGGVYLVVDHNARPASGREDTQKLHRIDPQTIRDEVAAAGFTLETDSPLLARPDDPHSAMVFAPDIRGKTDQAVLVFRKPG